MKKKSTKTYYSFLDGMKVGETKYVHMPIFGNLVAKKMSDNIDFDDDGNLKCKIEDRVYKIKRTK